MIDPRGIAGARRLPLAMVIGKSNANFDRKTQLALVPPRQRLKLVDA
jgi:hypothetical protein